MSSPKAWHPPASDCLVILVLTTYFYNKQDSLAEIPDQLGVVVCAHGITVRTMNPVHTLQF